MGVASDAAAQILAADGHGTLLVDVWSDFQPADPDTVTVCRDGDGPPSWQAYGGLPSVIYSRVQVLARGPVSDPNAAQERALDVWRKLGVVESRPVTVAGVPLQVTFTASGAVVALDDDDRDRSRYTVAFAAIITGLA